MSINKNRIRTLVTYLVLGSMIVSTIYAVTGIILTAADKMPDVMFFRQNRDYGLVLLQCLLGLTILFLPGLLEKRCKVLITNFVYIFFVVFLYAAIILGEVHDFYHRIPHWDTLLHGCSGIMLGAVGVSVIDIFNKSKKVNLNLSEGFTTLFAFFFAVALGVIWEIYEYFMDTFFGFNMQRYKTEDGTPLPGQAALYDTMKDLIFDAAGALVICTLVHIILKRRQARQARLHPTPAPR